MQSDNYNKRLVILLVLILTLQSVHRVVETLTIKVVQCKVPKKERERDKDSQPVRQPRRQPDTHKDRPQNSFSDLQLDQSSYYSCAVCLLVHMWVCMYGYK